MKYRNCCLFPYTWAQPLAVLNDSTDLHPLFACKLNSRDWLKIPKLQVSQCLKWPPHFFIYKCSIRVKAFGSSTEVSQATFYINAAVKTWLTAQSSINSYFLSLTWTNVLPPSSWLCVFYHMSKLTEQLRKCSVPWHWGTLSHPLALQQISLHLLANFLQNAWQKALVAAACFLHKWVFKTDVNVCMSQILRNGMCSLKIIHAEELPVQKGS